MFRIEKNRVLDIEKIKGKVGEEQGSSWIR